MNSSTSFDPLTRFTFFRDKGTSTGSPWVECSFSELDANARTHQAPRPEPDLELEALELEKEKDPVRLARGVAKATLDREKDTAGGVSFATYREHHRTNENLELVYVLGFDLDKGAIPEGLDACGLRGFRHTTYSHTEASPAWRLFLALSRPVTGPEYAILARSVRERLGLVGVEDPGAHGAARFWYLPQTPRAGAFQHVSIPGEPVDVDAILRDAPPVVATSAPVVLREGLDVGPDALRAAAELVAPHFKDGVRDRLGFALACAVLRMGLSAASTTALVTLVDELGPAPDKDPGKRPGETERAVQRLSEGGNATGVTTLRDVTGDNEIGRKLERALGLAPDAARILERMGTSTTGALSSAAPAANDTRALTFDDWLGVVKTDWRAHRDPPKYLVQDLIPAASVAMLLADSGAAKSWLALSLAAAISEGKPWLGRFATQKSRVLFLSYEMNEDEVYRRMKVLGDAPDMACSYYPDVGIHDPVLWKRLETSGYDFVIVDTYAAGAESSGVSENDAGAARPLQLAGKLAARSGTSTLFLHHENRSGSIRGTSALRAALDVKLDLTSKSEPKACGEKIVVVTADKFRKGRAPEPFTCRLTDARGLELVTGKGDTGATEQGAPSDRTRVLLRLGSHEPCSSLATLAKASGLWAGMNEKLFRDTFKALVAEGLAVTLDGKHQLDNPEAQRERITRVVDREVAHELTAKHLANLAHVTLDTIERARKDGWLDGPPAKAGHWFAHRPVATKGVVAS